MRMHALRSGCEEQKRQLVGTALLLSTVTPWGTNARVLAACMPVVHSCMLTRFPGMQNLSSQGLASVDMLFGCCGGHQGASALWRGLSRCGIAAAGTCKRRGQTKDVSWVLRLAAKLTVMPLAGHDRTEEA